jgi:hypothetical protein
MVVAGVAAGRPLPGRRHREACDEAGCSAGAPDRMHGRVSASRMAAGQEELSLGPRDEEPEVPMQNRREVLSLTVLVASLLGATSGGCGGSCGACDDGNPCTEDSCLQAGICDHVAATDATPCGQGVECFAGRCVEPWVRPGAIAAGGASTCALKKDGSVWCWGANEQGQLGTGKARTDKVVPVQVVAFP